jgi:hypothetical protein
VRIIKTVPEISVRIIETVTEIAVKIVKTGRDFSKTYQNSNKKC